MPSAHCLLREDLHYRLDAFCRGFAAAGYVVSTKPSANPSPDDVLCVWNRYGFFDEQARAFEAVGATVVVVENGLFGKDWRGGEWFTLTLGHYAGAGSWLDGGPRRWDLWDIELDPWRGDIGETVILGQRGFGEPGIAAPKDWAERTQREYRGRIRLHPVGRATVSLEHDLKASCRVLTWNSAAALIALKLGVPVYHEHAKWIGAEAARPLSQFGRTPKRDDVARLSMFRRIAWAIWELREIQSGEAFAHLLKPAS